MIACAWLRRGLVCVLTVATLAGAATSALAGKASFSIPVTGVVPIGAAVVTTSGALVMQNTGINGFGINFSLPIGYKADSTVKISMMIRMSGADCDMVFVPSSMTRRRVGALVGSGLDGLIEKGGGLMHFTGSEVVVQRVFRLKPGGSLAGQLRNESFYVSVVRDATDLTDTCGGSASVNSVLVTYRTID